MEDDPRFLPLPTPNLQISDLNGMTNGARQSLMSGESDEFVD